MIEFLRTLRRGPLLFVLAVLVLIGGCESGSPAGPDPEPEPRPPAEVAVILNSTELSITVVSVDDSSNSFTIGLAPEGTPATIAAHDGFVVVPMGLYPFAVVVDLDSRTVAHTVALPQGSGATGAAFLNDSIALVGNPDLNSVTPVNVRRGTAGQAIPVGTYPQSIVAIDGLAYVINANLDEQFSPAGPGTVSVIDGSLSVVDTIELSGLNPSAADFGGDGRLYVVNAGSWGASNGSLSVVDLAAREEIAHEAGFGDFPGSVAATTGRVLVGLYGIGILEWNPSTSNFVRDLDNPFTPGDIPPVADLGFDSEGRLFALNPGTCTEPGAVYRILSSGETGMAETGICPIALAFGTLPGE